jgi:hypothetical protein
MNMFILAEITSKWDISGVFCLASIPFLIILLIAYSKGPWSGSCTCLIFFFIATLATGDMGDAGSGSSMTPNSTFIKNKSKTKTLERYKYSIDDPKCIFRIVYGVTSSSENYSIFIPAEEMMVVDGMRKMISDGEEIGEDDYYLYDETYAPANVSVADGGYGVPQWLYHPASPVYIFGAGGALALLGGMFIAKKLF